MERILCDIQLGSKNQQVYVIKELYGKEKNIQSFSMDIDEIPNFIFKHNINDIILKGPKNFTQKIEEKVKEKELKDYTNTKINFKYMD